MITKRLTSATGERIFKDLLERYKLLHNRPDIHGTDGIYCLRKAYYDKKEYLPPTPNELLYFLTGLGLQDVLTQSMNANTICYQDSGLKILFSPDYIVDEMLIELKTTRINQNRLDVGEFPDGWIKQLKSYCKVLNKNMALLIVITLVSPAISYYELSFTDNEIEDNWKWLINRLLLLDDALKNNIPPEALNQDWECKECRYSARCKPNVL